MSSTSELTDTDLFIEFSRDPEKTCELRRMETGRCTRPAYVIAHLSKPCGHYNGFLLCEPCWNDCISGNIWGLVCGRCRTPFDIKACIVSWDLI